VSALRKEATMVRDGPAQPAPYPAEKARGGEIILRTRLRRAIFIGGLIAVAIVAVLLAFWR
jgi:hypothetical protein